MGSRAVGDRSRRLLALAVLLGSSFPRPASAVEYKWKGGAASNDLDQAGNWTQGAAPATSVVNNTLLFGNTTSGISHPNPYLQAPYTFQKITFKANDAFTFAGSTLTITQDDGLRSSSISMIDTNPQSIKVFGVPVVLGNNNSGGLVTINGGTLRVRNGVINNGTIRLLRRGSLVVEGGSTLVNNGGGHVDIITGSFTSAAGFTNSGVILDASAIKTRSVARQGSAFTVTIDVTRDTAISFSEARRWMCLRTSTWALRRAGQPVRC